MSVRKRPYNAGGKFRVAQRYTVQFADHHGVSRRLPAYTEKAASEELERKLKRLAALTATHTVVPPDLSHWIDALPKAMQARLAKWGLIDVRRLAAAANLLRHVDAYEQHLADTGCVPDHVSITANRLRRFIEAAGWSVAGDITAQGVTRTLARFRDGTDGTSGRRGEGAENGKSRRGLSQQTLNHYLTTVKALVRWMLANECAADTTGLQAVLRLEGQTVTIKRHERRALSGEELARLIQAAAAGPKRMKIPPAERALLYRLAAETGLRAGELRQLRRCDFDLSGPIPHIRVRAGTAKGKRSDAQPLRLDTLEVLAPMLEGKMPAATALMVPPHGHVAKMVRADLEAAREAWLGEAATPAERAQRGRIGLS